MSCLASACKPRAPSFTSARFGANRRATPCTIVRAQRTPDNERSAREEVTAVKSPLAQAEASIVNLFQVRSCVSRSECGMVSSSHARCRLACLFACSTCWSRATVICPPCFPSFTPRELFPLHCMCFHGLMRRWTTVRFSQYAAVVLDTHVDVYFPLPRQTFSSTHARKQHFAHTGQLV